MSQSIQHSTATLQLGLRTWLFALILTASAGPAAAALTTSILLKVGANTDVLIDPLQQFLNTVNGAAAAQLSSNAGDTLSEEAYALALSSAAADAGSLAVNAYSRVEGTFNGALVPYKAVGGHAEATVSFKIDDVIFSGPGPTVMAALRLDLSGTLGASAEPALIGTFTNGSAIFAVSLIINNGAQQLGTRAYASNKIGGQIGSNGIVFDTGPTAGINFPATVTFNPVLVLTNAPVTVEVLLYSLGAASLDSIGPGDGRAVGSALFGASAHFPLSGPVFQLPVGFSARSTSASVVNNNWLGTPVSAAPVPVPSAALLLGSAYACLARRRRALATYS